MVDKGNTIIVIEHNLDVIKQADFLVDMGPEGGEKGGFIVSMGTPEEIVEKGKGFTSTFLEKELNFSNHIS